MGETCAAEVARLVAAKTRSTAKPVACSCPPRQPLLFVPPPAAPLPSTLRFPGFLRLHEEPRSPLEVPKSALRKSRSGFPFLLSRHKYSSSLNSPRTYRFAAPY